MTWPAAGARSTRRSSSPRSRASADPAGPAQGLAQTTPARVQVTRAGVVVSGGVPQRLIQPVTMGAWSEPSRQRRLIWPDGMSSALNRPSVSASTVVTPRHGLGAGRGEHRVGGAAAVFAGALRLDDGPMTVHDLERLRRAPFRLILPSCESGVLALAGADELLGLASALLPLGTAGIVASVAQVNDQAAAPLMLALHRRLRSAGPGVGA